MILFVSDVQGRFDAVNAQIDHAERHAGQPVLAVVLPGDLGLCEPQLRRFFRTRGQRFSRPFYYIEGNHEDFDCFDANVARYADVMTHMPRGSVMNIGPHSMLALGGSAYMDSISTPARSLVRPDDIEACLRHSPELGRIIVSHDCPEGIGVPGSSILRHLGPPGLPGSRRLVDHFRPDLWVFGHHHRWFEAQINGTQFLGLPEAWRGYALLHHDGRMERVDHPLPPSPSRWQRLRARLLGST